MKRCGVVRADLGVAVLPGATYKDSTLVEITLPDAEARRHVGAIWQKDRRLPPAARRFTSFLTTWGAKVLRGRQLLTLRRAEPSDQRIDPLAVVPGRSRPPRLRLVRPCSAAQNTSARVSASFAIAPIAWRSSLKAATNSGGVPGSAKRSVVRPVNIAS